MRNRSDIGNLKNYCIQLVFTLLSLSKLLMKPPMWILIDDYIDHMISFFEILFEKGIESGHFRPHNPKSNAVAVFAGLDSIAAYMIIGKELILKEIVDHFDQDFILDIKVNST